MSNNDYIIKKHPLFDGTTNFDTVTSLINSAFGMVGKKLHPNYYEIIKDYKALLYTAIKNDETDIPLGGAITYNDGNYEYLCKLFVHPNHQNNGISKKLIQNVHIDKVHLAWRTHIEDNPLKQQTMNSYKKITLKLGGTVKEVGDYQIYLINMPKDTLDTLAEKIANKPSTLISQ